MANYSSLGEKAILILLAVLLVAVVTQQAALLTQPTTLETPGDATRTYFQAWNSKDYATMYSTISDGFKKIEQTASDLNAFAGFINSSTVEGVEILLINVTSNDGSTANVDYIVNYKIANTTARSASNFVLKYRPEDKPKGWKIIQPYGAKGDES